MSMSNMNSCKMDAVVFVCKDVFNGGHDVAGSESRAFPFNLEGMKEQTGFRYKFLANADKSVLLLIIDGPKCYSDDSSLKDLRAIEIYQQWIKCQIESVCRFEELNLPCLDHIYVCSHFGGGMGSQIAQKSVDIQRLCDTTNGGVNPIFRFCNISKTSGQPPFLYESGLHSLSALGLIGELEQAIKTYEERCAWLDDYERNMSFAYDSCMHRVADLDRISSRSQQCPLNKSLILLVAKENDKKGEDILKLLHEKIKGRKDVYIVLVSPHGAAVVIDADKDCEDKGILSVANLDWRPSVSFVREFKSTIHSSVNLFAFLPVKPIDSDKIDSLLAPWTVLSEDGLVYGYYAMDNRNKADTLMLLKMFSEACVNGPSAGVAKLTKTYLREKQGKRYYEIMKEMGHGD